MVTAGVMTRGLKGRRENCEKPIAGERAWGAAWRFVMGIEVFWSTMRVHISPNMEVISVWRLFREGRM